MIFIKNSYIVWAISGLLLGSGFYSIGLWPLSLIGGGLFFYQLLKEDLTNKNLFIGAVLAWSIKYSISISYFWSAHPLNFLPIDLGVAEPAIIFLYWSTGSLWLGLGVFILVLGRILIKKYYSNVSEFILLPIFSMAWVWSEIFGSLIFSFVTLGQGSVLNTAFSFGYSGYLLASHQLLVQGSALLGVYALSFIFSIIAGLIYLLIKNKQAVWAIGVFCVLFVSSGWSVIPEDSNYSLGNQAEVAVVDTHFESGAISEVLRFQQRQSLLLAVETALAAKPDYLILPEDAGFFIGPSTDRQNQKSIYENSDTVIIDSRTIRNNNELNLEAYIYDAGSSESKQIAKRYLVPQGEYMPAVYSKLFKFFGQEVLVEYIEDQIDYTVGEYTSQANLNVETPTVLFCFESVDPVGVRRLMSEHPETPFIAHPISHSWFNQSEMLWDQLDSMLRVQSIWSGTHIVSASNQGRSRVYTPIGSILEMEEIAKGKNWSIKKTIIKLP